MVTKVTDYELTIKNFFDSAMAILATNANKVNGKTSVDIEENLRRVRQISVHPHALSDYRTRVNKFINPSEKGFYCGRVNVYPEFIETLNAINLFYNSDLPTRQEILSAKIKKWNQAISGKRIKVSFARFLGRNLTHVR